MHKAIGGPVIYSTSWVRVLSYTKARALLLRRIEELSK